MSKKKHSGKISTTRKKMFTDTIKKAASFTVTAAVLAFITVAAIAYQKGVYDISYIERPTDSSVSETAPSADTETQPALPDASTDITASDSVPSAYPDSIAEYISTLDKTSALTDNGYEITDRVFDNGFVLTLFESEIPIGSKFSNRDRTVETPVRIPNEDDSGYTTEMKEETQAVPLAEIYMDYLIVDNGDSFTVLGADGTVIAEDFDLEKYVPAYTRDKKDNALFSSLEQSPYNKKAKITKYYYFNQDGELKVSNYNDAADNRGVYANYPSYYGKAETDLKIHYSSKSKLYGYGGESGVKDQEDLKYIAAYNHSEGLCAAVETDGLLYFLNEKLTTKISAEYEFYKYYGNTRRRLLRHLILPDTFGEETFGFFYFDHGLCRVRAQTIDAWHWQEYQKRYINADEDILIRIDGNEFPIPTDYKLISYSNGMLLLEKNGLYGYMDYTGKWIISPEYTHAKPFREGLAVVGTQGKLGLMDTAGNYVLPPLFDYISNVSGGIITAYDNETGWYVFNKTAPIPVQEADDTI